MNSFQAPSSQFEPYNRQEKAPHGLDRLHCSIHQVQSSYACKPEKGSRLNMIAHWPVVSGRKKAIRRAERSKTDSPAANTRLSKTRTSKKPSTTITPQNQF